MAPAIGRSAPLLLVFGSDAEATERKQGGSRVRGNSDFHALLPDSVAFEQLNLRKQFLKQQGRPDLGRYECVVNLITDPDQHPKTLEVLSKLLRGYRGRIVNHPDKVLRTGRADVAKRLAGIANLHVPRTLRLRVPRPGAVPQSLKDADSIFPALLRQAGTHGGEIVGKIGTAVELADALSEPGEYVLTEFADFRSDDGLYRKYRVFFIGGERIFRHLIVADGWSIHAKERFAFMKHHSRLIEEELELLVRPAGAFPPLVDTTLEAVRQAMGLEYFGMDFGIAPDGRVVLFEANATMNFFPVVDDPPFEHIVQVIEPSRRAFCDLVGAAARQAAAW